MNIIIVGCGKVGCTLAEQLCNEEHQVVVIDTNSDKIQQLSEDLDLLGITGNGSSIRVLSEAGLKEADILIAVTGSDELNLLCCLIAKKVSSCHTIARVRNPIYNKEIHFIKERLGVSMIIIEDKTGLKKNSLFGTEVAQTQDSIENFCHKIAMGKRAQKTKDFMIVARVESLILERGTQDALERAFAYVEAGADGIMIHSRKKDPAEIFEFVEKFRKQGLPDDVAVRRIKRDTNWERNASGQWVYETDDSAARIRNRAQLDGFLRKARAGHPQQTMLIGEVLDHPELFEMYPWLRDLNVIFFNDKTPFRSGIGEHGIMLNTRYLTGTDGETGIKGSLLHEMQHIVQSFEVNGNVEIDVNNIRSLWEGLQALVAGRNTPATDEVLGESLGEYIRDPEEVDARNVAMRLAYNADRRRNTPLPVSAQEYEERKSSRGILFQGEAGIEEKREAAWEAFLHSAVPMMETEFTREEYNRLFPMGEVDTPTGKVRMGGHQFERLKDKGRENYLGAMYQTLHEPSVVIDSTDAQGRTAQLFIKSFTGKDGQEGKRAAFSVVVNREGVGVFGCGEPGGRSRCRIIRAAHAEAGGAENKNGQHLPLYSGRWWPDCCNRERGSRQHWQYKPPSA